MLTGIFAKVLKGRVYKEKCLIHDPLLFKVNVVCSEELSE